MLFMTLTVPIYLHRMRFSAINASYVMSEAKIFKNINLNKKNQQELETKKKRTTEMKPKPGKPCIREIYSLV